MYRMSFTRAAGRFITLTAVAGACAVGAAGCATGPATPVAASPVGPSVTATPAGVVDTTDATASASATGGGLASASGSGAAYPIACGSFDSNGGFTSPSPSSLSLAQIGTAVGFQVSSAVLDTQSTLGFHGYEGCRYQFTTPSGGAQLDVSVVLGTDPTTFAHQSAAQDLADTKAQKMPRSERGCSGDCTWQVAATPGIGDEAYTLTSTDGTTVVVALRGDLYVEVGPGDLKVERELSLARAIFSNVH